MSYTIKLIPLARKDLKEAKKWHDNISKKLGDEFKDAVNAEIDYIGEYPEHFQKRYKELRLSLVKRFSFAILYLIDDKRKMVIIFGVLHTRRNPEIARKRIK